MNTKYQTIRRFAQKQGFEVVELAATRTPKLLIKTPSVNVTIQYNLSKDGIDAIVTTKEGLRILTVLRFTQKAIVEYLSSDSFAELMAEHQPQEADVEPEVIEEESAELIERITEAKTLAERVRTELASTGTLFPQTKEQHHKAIKEYGGLYTANLTQAEITTIDSLDHKPAPTDFNIMKMNYEESERIYKRNKKHVQQKECYSNVYHVIFNDSEVYEKVERGEWHIGYGFMQIATEKSFYVRHAFLINEHNEIIDVTQFMLSNVFKESDYHVVYEVPSLKQYAEMLKKTDYFPSFDVLLLDYFIPYQNKMWNAGLVSLG